MAKFNIQQNFSGSLRKDNLEQYGMAALAPIWATVVPTIIGINGWFGFIVAYVIPLLVGMGLKSVGLVSGTVAIMLHHLIYQYGDPAFINDIEPVGINNGNGIWALEANNLRWIENEETKKYEANPNYGQKKLNDAPTSNEYVNYGELPSGSTLLNVNGQTVAVYDKKNLNDYIVDSEVYDFAKVNLNDYFLPENTENDVLKYSSNYKQVM